MNKEIVGKNLLDKEPILTGNRLPKIIGITENKYYEYEKLQQENKKLIEDINNLMNIINRNCGELSTTNEEYESLKRWSI